ncbi:hypothetical protein KIW84_064413 [Lathyrus oleraceus]|uniref:Uncharacterized protein n=1 Tax=Pisum sativum TaxID=3888 RepID=A0A9D4WCK0_PEA|nr:hypothetical protein KIW84_064413 [Pisum sativum]
MYQSFSRLGFPGFAFSESKGFAGGIAMGWKANKLQVHILKSHFQFLHSRIIIEEAWKSPRLDGFSVGFYQNTRNLTGENIFSLTQQLWHKDASLGNSAYYAQIQE